MCSTLTKGGKLRSEPLAPGACQLPQIWPAHQHAAIYAASFVYQELLALPALQLPNGLHELAEAIAWVTWHNLPCPMASVRWLGEHLRRGC